jgi:hypothetical protein
LLSGPLSVVQFLRVNLPAVRHFLLVRLLCLLHLRKLLLMRHLLLPPFGSQFLLVLLEHFQQPIHQWMHLLQTIHWLQVLLPIQNYRLELGQPTRFDRNLRCLKS